jgi:signal transduction histidine kinase
VARSRLGGFRDRELRRHGRVAGLGDDPVPFRLDQPDLALRVSGLASRCHVPDTARGRDGHRRDARRRQDALGVVERQAAQRASLLERQERFLHDASHELRTPVTIARGHLEVHRRTNGNAAHEIDVALDELQRIEQILGLLLLLAKADQPDFVIFEEVDLEPYLEDVFMRWSEVAPRAWNLGALVAGTLTVDPEGLRAALDALLENAVKYTESGDTIELRSRASAGDVVIEVADGGEGVPPEALAQIFERFARADAARTRAKGGVGLGLAIVDAIAKAHGGRCTVKNSQSGATFALRLPRFEPASVSALRLLRNS